MSVPDSMPYLPCGVEITTDSQQLLQEFFSLHMPDVRCEIPLQKDTGTAYVALVGFLTGTGINLFSQWLYDVIKKWASSHTKVAGNQINTNMTAQQINILIKNVIINHYAKAESHKEPEDT